MSLSNDLVSQFIKVTNDNTGKKNEKTTTYGTIINSGGQLFVQLDGSELLTPFDTTTEIRDNDRVIVDINGHNAIVSGNISNPSISKVTAGELESTIEQTAESLTINIKNTKAGLESKIQQTASGLRTSIEDVNSNLNTELDLTASSLRSSINNVNSGLTSKIEQTASSLTTSINNVNSNLSSKITQTESNLTIKFNSGYSQGITNINNQGIWVSQSNYSGHTHMTNHGFYVNNGKEDVLSATASGLSVKGTVTITAGSININNNFIVSSAGALTTNSTIVAQGGLYTYQDIRGMDQTSKTGGLTVVTGTGNLSVRNESESHGIYLQPALGKVYVTYPNKADRCDMDLRNVYGIDLIELSGTGAFRASHNGHLYLQCGQPGQATLTNSEVRCTRSAAPNDYVNIRAYNVCAQNQVFANGVQVSSDRDRKRDIELYEINAIKEVCATPVYTYHLDTDLDHELKRIGLIMQEAPLDVIDLSGKGIDLYQMVTMLWRAVQQQQDMIESLL